MKDMVAGVAVGKAANVVVSDLGKEEDNLGQSDMPIAMAQRTKDILLLQMDGLLTKEEIEKALEMAEKGVNEVNALQIEALVKNYETALTEAKLKL